MPESIEDYLHSLLAIIAQSPIVGTSNVGLDKRTPRAGLIRGDVTLLDGSRLYFRELVDVKAGVSRIMYSYHYQAADGALIFRYDDTPHHLQLGGFPHHKHVGEEKNIVDAAPPDLDRVLREIETSRDWGRERAP
jgi:hypothetical protein